MKGEQNHFKGGANGEDRGGSKSSEDFDNGEKGGAEIVLL